MTKTNKLAPNNSTGCYILDAAGVSSSQSEDGVEICTGCELPKCILKSKDDARIEKRRKVLEEKTVICLECGAEETLIFKGGRLGRTRSVSIVKTSSLSSSSVIIHLLSGYNSVVPSLASSCHATIF